MTDPTTGARSTVPPSPDVPTATASVSAPPARRGLLVLLLIAAISAPIANYVPAILILPIKTTMIDPHNATTLLSIVDLVGALAALITFPAFGRLSDRTTSRFGRRRPYLVLGAILFLAGTITMNLATTLPGLIIANVIIGVGYAASTVAFTSIIADQIPAERRGPASAVVGIGLPAGVLVGLFLANIVSPNLTLEVLVPGIVSVIGTLLLAILVRDRAIRAEDRPKFGLKEFGRTYWVNPFTNPSFGWAWFSRLLIFFGVVAVQVYQTFYLIFVLHFKAATVSNEVFLSTLVLVAMAVIFATIAGRLSDRVGRRKPFVIAAAIIFGAGLCVTAVAHSFPVFLVGIGLVGLGQGVYLAVDIALVTQILPDPQNPAKDLGIMNLASALPSSLVPALAPLILLIGASATAPQNYSSLFLAGAIAGLIGAALIIPIRKVR